MLIVMHYVVHLMANPILFKPPPRQRACKFPNDSKNVSVRALSGDEIHSGPESAVIGRLSEETLVYPTPFHFPLLLIPWHRAEISTLEPLSLSRQGGVEM